MIFNNREELNTYLNSFDFDSTGRTAYSNVYFLVRWDGHEEPLYFFDYMGAWFESDCELSCASIGECGLDYNRNFSPQDVQRKWFEAQIEVAEKLEMPLFLHEREAHEDLYNILKRHESVVEKSVVHCFTGTKQEAQNYIDLGCYIGVTGWICDMKRGKDLQEAVSVIPPEKLMIETDAPFLIPKNFDFKPKKNRNEPKYLPHILETIAYYMEIDSQELKKQVSKNTKKFFKI